MYNNESLQQISNPNNTCFLFPSFIHFPDFHVFQFPDFSYFFIPQFPHFQISPSLSFQVAQVLISKFPDFPIPYLSNFPIPHSPTFCIPSLISTLTIRNNTKMIPAEIAPNTKSMPYRESA